MKKLYTLAATLLATTSLLAQNTLTSADITYLGDGFYQKECDTTGVQAGAAGNGITWDFSGLIPKTDSTFLDYIDPATTAYASSFTAANVALEEENGALSYFELTTDEYNYYGSVTDDGTGGTIKYTYSDPARYFSFPLAFGNTSSDNLAAGYTAGGLVYTRTGTIDTEYDGFGTLILPTGTFTDVSRVKIFEDNHDVATVQGFPINVDVSITTYEWITKGNKSPLLIISYVKAVTSGVTTLSKIVKMATKKSSGVGITENNTALELSIFPSPATNSITITSSENTATINLLDISGKQLTHNLKLNQENDISNLQPGIYLIRLNSNNNSTVKRFIKK